MAASAPVTKRDLRAAREPMDVVENDPAVDGAVDMYAVYHRGTRYIVDLRQESCECPDSRYRDTACKHVRRVQMQTGDRAIPPVPRLDRHLQDVDDGEERGA